MTTLILTPTQQELHALEPRLAPCVRRNDGLIECCGFGPIAAAARTMQLIGTHRPTRVILVGIAGGLRPELEVGSARTFRRVTCDGIGAGTGADYTSASEIGWQQGGVGGSAEDEAQLRLGDVIRLAPSLNAASELCAELLTVCAASANEADVAMRLDRYPDAVAEDMEGFGVAMACDFGNVPLQIIRGISNRAGDRDKRKWKIDAALDAASELTIKCFETDGHLSP